MIFNKGVTIRGIFSNPTIKVYRIDEFKIFDIHLKQNRFAMRRLNILKFWEKKILMLKILNKKLWKYGNNWIMLTFLTVFGVFHPQTWFTNKKKI